MRKALMTLLLGLLGCSSVSGQITIPNTFVAGTTASAAQVNVNFSALGATALNRTGGTITGNIAVDSGFTIDGVDISAILGGGAITTGVATFTSTTAPQLNVRYDASNHLGVSISSTGGVTFNATGSGAGFTFSDAVTVGTLTCTGCVGETQLAATAVTAGSYGNGTSSLIGALTVDVDGRLTSITAATGFLREDTAATISAAFTFTAFPMISGTSTQERLYESDQSADERYWITLLDGKTWSLRAYNDALNSSASAITVGRGTGTAIASVGLAATTVTVDGTLSMTASVSAGQIVGTAGSTTYPAFTFSGDTNTGLYSPPNDAVGITAGGTAIAVFAKTGGTTAGQELYLAGTIVPSFTNTWDFGTTGVRWKHGYFVDITSTNAVTVSSDRRLKQDISPLELGIEFIDALKPVSYRLKASPERPAVGFIAQDIQELGFSAALDASDPELLKLSYTSFIAPLVKGLQDVHKEVHTLEEIIKIQQDQIALLRAEVASFRIGKAAQ